MKELWKDPEYRERILSKMREHRAKTPRYKRSRLGVPDGMRKWEAMALWEDARKQAKRFIQIMEDADQVEKAPVPGSDAAMAKAALEEAYTMMVGPLTDVKSKAQYIRIVLDFTKSKPESKQKITLDNSEAWLDALEKDMKDNGSDA